jgi:hypothetical protein
MSRLAPGPPLARGNYCPKEHRQHAELAVHAPEIAVACDRVNDTGTAGGEGKGDGTSLTSRL